jgi:ABC-type Fe3+/spermidine/putrescine transport system ATPase subunit/ABC-type sulfate transport system permease component
VDRGGLRSPLPWLGALLLVYLGAPVVYFLYRLATTPTRGFQDAGLFPAFWVSIQGATIATVVVAALGVPLAFFLARHRGPLVAVLGTLVMVPLAVPPVMSGILLLYVIGPYTPIGSFFGGHLTTSLLGVVLAQSFVAAPFLVVTTRAAFNAVDPTLRDAAATLGHGPLARFARVEMPAAAPGIRAGMVLCWLRAFGEYGATVVVAYHPSSLNIYTYIQFASTGLTGTLAPTALALGVAAVAVALSRLVVARYRRRRHDVGTLPAPRHPAPPAPAPLRFDVRWRLGDFHLAVAHDARALRLAVLGPSGAGKSALLRCLAGLYGPAPGPVAYGGHRVEAVPVERRRIGYVGQGFGLFPHLSVWEQVLFARDADPGIAAYWLEAFHLAGLERRLPSELSGGERQRVALAQALARSPDVLLLDEPFSALDVPVRVELRRELRRLQRDVAISTVIVTHDPEEAALLADEVIVVVDGRVLQQGPTLDVYDHPGSPRVAELLGVRNVGAASVREGGWLRCDGGILLRAQTRGFAAGTPVLWRIRPADVVVSAGNPRGSEGEAFDAQVFDASLDDLSWLGGRVEARVALAPGLVLEADGAEITDMAVGSPVQVTIAPGDVRVWGVRDEPPDVLRPSHVGGPAFRGAGRGGFPTA